MFMLRFHIYYVMDNESLIDTMNCYMMNKVGELHRLPQRKNVLVGTLAWGTNMRWVG